MASKEEGTCAPHSTCPKQLGIGHAGSQPACGLQWPRLEVWRLGSCQLQSRFVSPSSNSIPLPWPHFGFAAPPPARHKKDTATPRHRDTATRPWEHFVSFFPCCDLLSICCSFAHARDAVLLHQFSPSSTPTDGPSNTPAAPVIPGGAPSSLLPSTPPPTCLRPPAPIAPHELILSPTVRP